MSMIINPFRFAVAAAWEDSFTFTSMQSVGGWANYVMRSSFDRALLKPSASKFRATFRTLGSDQLQLTKAYIGRGSSCTFSATPTQIFFGGNAGVTVTSTGVQCDEVDFAYDGTDNIILSYYCPSGASAQTASYSNNLPMGLRRSFNLSDITTQVGGTWSVSGTQTISVSELDTFVTSVWTEVFKATTAPQVGGSGQSNTTFRTRFETGVFPTSFSSFRLGIPNQVTDIFIGNAVDTTGSFEFASTPTRLTFGAANGSPTNYDKVHMTDVAALSVLDRTKPVLVSFHNTPSTTFFIPFGANATGTRSKYRAGNFASTLAETGFVQLNGDPGDYFGPLCIDVQ